MNVHGSTDYRYTDITVPKHVHWILVRVAAELEQDVETYIEQLLTAHAEHRNQPSPYSSFCKETKA